MLIASFSIDGAKSFVVALVYGFSSVSFWFRAFSVLFAHFLQGIWTFVEKIGIKGYALTRFSVMSWFGSGCVCSDQQCIGNSFVLLHASSIRGEQFVIYVLSFCDICYYLFPLIWKEMGEQNIPYIVFIHFN